MLSEKIFYRLIIIFFSLIDFFLLSLKIVALSFNFDLILCDHTEYLATVDFEHHHRHNQQQQNKNKFFFWLFGLPIQNDFFTQICWALFALWTTFIRPYVSHWLMLHWCRFMISILWCLVSTSLPIHFSHFWHFYHSKIT